jgi:hypothetical protein
MKLIFALSAFFVSLAPAQEKSATPQEMIQWLFRHAEALERISFAEIAQAASGKKVIPLDQTNTLHAQMLQHVQKAAREVVATLNGEKSPVRGLRRINEASKHVEDLLVKALAHGDFQCTFPKNAQGEGQRSGYPDLELTHVPSGLVTYVDPKLFEETARQSTLRTFYFEPRQKTTKITKDACHLLLGFSHDGKDGQWTFGQPELVDVSKLQVRLKAEFDASNKDVYRPENVLKVPEK